MTPSPLDLAEVAYRAYGDWADWTNYAGNAMPAWEALPEPQRNAWAAAAGAVERALLQPRSTANPHRSRLAADAAAACTGTCTGSNTGGRA